MQDGIVPTSEHEDLLQSNWCSPHNGSDIYEVYIKTIQLLSKPWQTRAQISRPNHAHTVMMSAQLKFKLKDL
jgi:hypothetical protein